MIRGCDLQGVGHCHDLAVATGITRFGVDAVVGLGHEPLVLGLAGHPGRGSTLRFSAKRAK